ncbi:hypothetical protein [Neptunomonas sp.]|uniref:hypothetical protein n=1 Tax=Neptunomonas sp. TaxID=1971898 RepID=UPI0025EE6B19|nr:hypothetical protein [Neptunomonas sp.]
MDKILKGFELLGGIHHCCLMHSDEMKASTFPELLEENMTGACRVLYQMFMAVEGMGCTHREIFIELDDNLLIGYYITDETVLAMLTEKEVNLALINTSVRSSLGRIKKQLAPQSAEAVAPQGGQAPAPNRANQGRMEVELMGLMGKLQEGLAEYIGPAAEIVFDDAYDQWKTTHGVKRSKIAELIKVLASEIEDKADRSRYLQGAVHTVRSFNAQLAR